MSASAASLPILQKYAAKKKGEPVNSPICVIVVGMAGSGKSTLTAQLQRSLATSSVPTSSTTTTTTAAAAASKQVEEEEEEVDEGHGKEKDTEKKKTGYCLNLDPATIHVAFGASIDIRDTVDYKQVMQQHQLGPNGAIMTCLNLFCTKFDQVMTILESKTDVDYILVDTPGQIEAFTWSASGSIMSEALASAFPTVLVFVVDTVRCASSPNTFMSNMLYACSMLYRTRLPLVVVFNKIDVVPHAFCVEWMTNYESFQQALDDASEEMGFYGSLTRSLSLVLDEFYSQLHTCGVSAATGDGLDDFWRAVNTAALDFETDYVLDLQLKLQEMEAKERAKARDSARRLERDIQKDAQEQGDGDAAS